MIAVIMAGGKGSRLVTITKDIIPKPMVLFCGIPILENQINILKSNGISEYILVVGYLKDKIIDYFGNGEKFGVTVSYVEEAEPLGTAGALYYIKNKISDDFLLVFGDTIFDININRMLQFHLKNQSIATLFIHPNSHPYDSDLVVVDEKNKIIGIDSKNNKRDYFYHNCVNAGFYILSSKILFSFKEPQKLDMEKNVLSDLINNNEAVYGYKSSEYIKDVGTVDRITMAENDNRNNTIKSKNLDSFQKCIFIDRDGTLNKYIGLLTKPEQLELIENSDQAVKLINSSNYLVIVITNQPVVARGMCLVDDVKIIHKKLETVLGSLGAYVDDILFCPHHPDKGYPKENPLYKIVCNCRKPEIGMIEECVKKYNIDISKSWFIGDTTRDVQTGVNAGLKTVLVLTGECGNDKKYDVTPDYICENLFSAVKKILEIERKI